MKFRLARYQPGQRPKATDWNKVVELLEQVVNISVDGTSGLNIEWTGTGLKLSLDPPAQGKYIVVTEEISAAIDDDHPGHGMGMVRRCQYAADGSCTVEDTGVEELIYSFASAPITVDTQVQTKIIDGRRHVDVEKCEGTT